MAISNFPAALVPIIQQNFLDREFGDALQSVTAFRAIADREEFSIGVGETITKTRAGLKHETLEHVPLVHAPGLPHRLRHQRTATVPRRLDPAGTVRRPREPHPR